MENSVFPCVLLCTTYWYKKHLQDTKFILSFVSIDAYYTRKTYILTYLIYCFCNETDLKVAESKTKSSCEF